MSRAESFGKLQALRVYVDGDDFVCAGNATTLDGVQADASRAEHDGAGTGRDFRHVHRRAVAGHNAAADDARGAERDTGILFHQRLLEDHGVRGHGADVERALDALALEHRPLQHRVTLHVVGRGDLIAVFTNIPLAVQALEADAARDGPVEHNFVARYDSRGAFAYLAHDARPLMADHDRPAPVQRIPVGVADARRLDFHQHLVAGGRMHFDFLDGKTAGAVRNGGFSVNHGERLMSFT